MKKAYICSPYRAKDSIELDRNIDYAQYLTRRALSMGFAPVTPHLYMTQCLDEDKPEERARGMAAGLELLKGCDLVLAGTKYGISEGMKAEITAAAEAGIRVVSDRELNGSRANGKQADHEAAALLYARLNACKFCKGRHFHTCTCCDCREPFTKAYKYALKHPFYI